MRDLLLDDTGDLKIVNGSVAIGDAKRDNERLLLLIEKGELRSAPLRTVGLRSYLDDENPDAMMREIRRQFERDGMKVRRLDYSNGKLSMNTAYD